MKNYVKYVGELELVVQTCVESRRKQVKELKIDHDHYEKKLET